MCGESTLKPARITGNITGQPRLGYSCGVGLHLSAVCPFCKLLTLRASENSPTEKLSDVCLYLQDRRIFREGVQVRGSATYFSRPSPTLAFAPTRPGAKIFVGALPSGQWHHECA